MHTNIETQTVANIIFTEYNSPTFIISKEVLGYTSITDVQETQTSQTYLYIEISIDTNRECTHFARLFKKKLVTTVF